MAEPINYELSGGKVLRNGVAVATYEPNEGQVEMLPGFEKFVAPVKRWLAEQGQEAAPDVPAELADGPVAPSMPAVVQNESSSKPGAAAAVTESEPVADELPKYLGYAGAPYSDKMLGDKDPVFVEWLRDNHPADYAKRYSNRKIHLN